MDFARLVIDASVGIKLVIAEAGSDAAHALFSHAAATEGSRLYVPDLFYTECANVLWKYVKRFGYSAKDAQKNIERLIGLGLIRLETDLLLKNAFAIAVTHEISVYDACYVAASMHVSAPLVTADERLVTKLAKISSPPRLLGTLDL